MRVLISWSGERSKIIAEALVETLHSMIITMDKPWMSSEDIQPGARWSAELAEQLEASSVGIICLTPDNLNASWVQFEAGALSKAIGVSHVCPYLFDLEYESVKGPLAQFQAVRADKDGTKKIVHLIYDLLDDNSKFDKSRLEKQFEKYWPDLEKRLKEIDRDRERELREKTQYENYKETTRKRETNSLFDKRRGHYSDEKAFVCRKFLDVMLQNRDIIDSDKIYLLIDSGSTVYPIFQYLCDYYWDGNYKDILEKIEIFTNNIPGFSTLLISGKKGNADIIYKCNVIPGRIEGKYGAILGEDSITHFNHIAEKIKEKAEGEKVVFVSAITGNYISIPDGLLWRGNYHGAMKSAYVLQSDYIFILSPLGKIFDMTADQINRTISESHIATAMNKSYKKLSDLGEHERFLELETPNLCSSCIHKLLPRDLIKTDPNKIFLITTKREAKNDSLYPNPLLNYFINIRAKLHAELGNRNILDDDFSPEIDSEKVVGELKRFSSQRYDIFYNYEFPHEEIKRNMEKHLR